jgi:DNA polymerase-4
MASATALRLCPQLVIVPHNFARYKAESRKIREVFHEFTEIVEPLSLDEAYLDVSDVSLCGGSATLMAQEIRAQIFRRTGLTASAGVAENKFLAKIASDMNKPNGLTVIKPRDVELVMRDLPIEKIWGVGKVTAQKMRAMNLKTCGDLQALSLAELSAAFGNWGAQLYDYARGVDHRSVHIERARKSLSVEETFSHDVHTLKDCLKLLPDIYDDWLTRLRRSGESEKIKGMSVKLKFQDFSQLTRDRAVNAEPSLDQFAKLLTEAFEVRCEPVRLIGIGVKLEAPEKPSRNAAQLTFEVD